MNYLIKTESTLKRDNTITIIPRIQYDISLLLSCLLTKHRFDIMKNDFILEDKYG